jgi:dienelactone hydrolase
MRRYQILLMSLIICTCACKPRASANTRGAPPAPDSPNAAPPGADVVAFRSGDLSLYGVLYRPEGEGPFPAILYNHGSAPGLLNNAAFEAIGPLFKARGWVFFAPWRRGQGLSASAGSYISDEVDRGRSLTRLLETDHLNDQLAALAWLRSTSYTMKDSIAVGGNSFGGILALLGAERDSYCAAVDASGGAMTWAHDRDLRISMERAARGSQTPIFLFQAENDFDLSPTRILSNVMKQAGRPFEAKIYPPYGESEAQAHSFAYRGASIWFEDVFSFVEKHCRGGAKYGDRR